MRSLVLALSLLAGGAVADDSLVTFTASATAAPLAYVEYLPPGYSSGTAAERILFYFHGIGDSGSGADATDVFNALTSGGPLRMIRDAGTGPHLFKTSHRAIVLAPRNPQGLWDRFTAAAFFSWALTHYRVDADAVYLTGLSAGGGPAWTIPIERPGTVTAIVPVCPVRQLWNPFDASEYRNVAVWAFHGFGDPIVSRGDSQLWMDQIGQALARDPSFPGVMTTYPFRNGNQSAGQDQTAVWTPSGYAWSSGTGAPPNALYRYTMYDADYHNIWGGVYTDLNVWDWLFARRRSTHVDPGATTPDAGTMPDAGSAPDAGAMDDAGSPPDAGAMDDAGSPPDAGTVDDAGGAPDAGTVDDAGEPFEEEDSGSGEAPDGGAPSRGRQVVLGGCSSAAGLPFGVVGLLLLLRRRRRQRAPQAP